MADLTKETIEELRGLLAKATPGPWSIHPVDDTTIISPAREVATTCDSAQTEREDGYNIEYEQMEVDAAFIVAMRNALPALLASLASKDAEIERLNEWKSRLHSQVDDFAERYAQAAQEPKQLRAELTTALAALGEARDEVRDLMRAYVSTIEAGRDRIIDLGGQCDPVDVMEAADPALRKARATLAKLNALEGNEDG